MMGDDQVARVCAALLRRVGLDAERLPTLQDDLERASILLSTEQAAVVSIVQRFLAGGLELKATELWRLGDTLQDSISGLATAMARGPEEVDEWLRSEASTEGR